ncbi:MAG: hypothetical protein P8X74_02710 [Reinekea sp.]
MLPKNWSEPMGTPAIFEKNRNQWLPLCIHSGVTDSGSRHYTSACPERRLRKEASVSPK